MRVTRLQALYTYTRASDLISSSIHAILLYRRHTVDNSIAGVDLARDVRDHCEILFSKESVSKFMSGPGTDVGRAVVTRHRSR